MAELYEHRKRFIRLERFMALAANGGVTTNYKEMAALAAEHEKPRAVNLQNRGLNCPAETQGEIGACHFCKYVSGGGNSDMCLEKVNNYRRRQKLTGSFVPLSKNTEESNTPTEVVNFELRDLYGKPVKYTSKQKRRF